MAAKVLIAIPLVQNVSAEFFKSFYPAQLLLPEEGETFCEVCKWGNTVNNRNDLVKSFLETKYSHLFFMDSDMSFPEATLSRLLQHDKDVIGGFYVTKIPPFHSTCFIGNYGDTTWLPYTPKIGECLKQVTAIATGCMLIKRKVLEPLKWPWFYYKPEPFQEKFATEDVAFCLDATDKGFEIWCDFTVRCGHNGNMVVTPFMNEGQMQGKIEVV